MPPSLSTLLTAAAALGAVLALVLVAGRAARRAGLAQTGRSRRLLMVDSLALDRTRRVCIVRVDQRDLLLLTGGGADAVIGWLPTPGDGA